MRDAPLVTFALLSFNQQEFVAEAIRSALTQTYSPLEILISDDLSTDDTWNVIKREIATYSGPHRIRLHRNEVNLSCTVHTLSALAMAEADLVVFGAGDDISEPERVAAIAAVAAEQPDALSFWSDVRLIDEDGRDMGIVSGYGLKSTATSALAEYAAAPGGASQAYRKKIGEFFGEVDRRAASEDIVLHFRAALLGRVAKVPGILVRWRRHAKSMETINALTEGVDPETFRRKVIDVGRQKLFCCRARLRDLAELESKCPERAGEIRDYVVATQRMIRRYEAVLELGRGPIFLLPKAFVKGLWSGLGLRRIIKDIAALRFPALWQRYARYRAGKLAANR